MRGTLYFDGGCRPTNPGVAAFACILEREDGLRKEVARHLGWRTNNYAEYVGLIVGLKIALDNDVDDIVINTDSQLILGHIVKGWRRNNPELRVMAREAEQLLEKFYGWDLRWWQRKNNTEADELCTAIIIERRNKNPWKKK